VCLVNTITTAPLDYCQLTITNRGSTLTVYCTQDEQANHYTTDAVSGLLITYLDRQQLQHGGFGSLTDTIFSFASSLKIMEVDDLEYAALSAVCLVSNGKLSIVQKPHQWCNG
jgi:hypothetical protein